MQNFLKKNVFEVFISTVFIFWYLLILPHIPVFDGDTFYYLNKAVRMLASGDWLNTSSMMAKPVLGLWFCALSLVVYGRDLFGIYFWHVAFSAGTLLVVYRFLHELVSRRAAQIASIVLLTSLMFFYQTASPMLDIPMVFFLVLSISFLYHFILTKQRTYLLATAFFCGLNFLTKGLEGALIPGAVFFLYMIAQRQNPLKEYKHFIPHVFAAGVVFSIVISIWLIPQFMTHGQAFGQLLYRENIERFFHPIDETGGYRQVSSKVQVDPHLNIIYLMLAFLPWSALMVPAILTAYKQKYFGQKKIMQLLLAWFYFVLFVTTFSGHYKGPRYLLPLLPALAMMMGIYLDSLFKKDFKLYIKTASRTFLGIGIFLIVLCVAVLTATYTHGEEQYIPLVLPVLFLLAGSMFAGYYFWKRSRYAAAFSSVVVVTIVAYTLFLTSAATLVPRLIPEYRIAKYLKATTTPKTTITVYKNKIASLDYYLGRKVEHIDDETVLRNTTGVIVLSQAEKIDLDVQALLFAHGGQLVIIR